MALMNLKGRYESTSYLIFFFFNVTILPIDIFENLDLRRFSDLYSYCLLKCFIFISPWNDSVEGSSGATNMAFDPKGPNLYVFLFLFFPFSFFFGTHFLLFLFMGFVLPSNHDICSWSFMENVFSRSKAPVTTSRLVCCSFYLGS